MWGKFTYPFPNFKCGTVDIESVMVWRRQGIDMAYSDCSAPLQTAYTWGEKYAAGDKRSDVETGKCLRQQVIHSHNIECISYQINVVAEYMFKLVAARKDSWNKFRTSRFHTIRYMYLPYASTQIRHFTSIKYLIAVIICLYNRLINPWNSYTEFLTSQWR